MFTNKKLHGLLTLLVLMLIAVLTACSGNDASEAKTSSSEEETISQGGKAVIGYPQDISNFDPIKGNAGGDHALLWPIYDTLISFNENLEPRPGLAKDWEFVDDTTLVLYLQEGVTFHDGTEFNAEVVKYNLERVNSEDSTVSDISNVESVEVIDEYTVSLKLKNPDNSILLSLSDRAGMMVSPAAAENGDLSQNPVGAGPYKFVSRIPNGEIVYEGYENYYKDGQPYLDEMVIKIMEEENTRINALKSGEVDFIWNISPGNISTLEGDPNITLAGDVASRFKVIYINNSMEPFDKQEVRQAVQIAINREDIIQAINFGVGEPAYQLFPKNFWASDENMKIPHDPEKAKQILEEAGLTDITFELTHYPTAYDTRIAEAIQSQLGEIGIKVDLQAMELTAAVSTYFAEKNTSALLSDWNGRPDPQMSIHGVFSGDSYYNAGGQASEELEKLIDEASKEYVPEKRQELYVEITRRALLEEAIAIPIFFVPAMAAMNDNVTGYEPNMYGKPKFADIQIKN